MYGHDVPCAAPFPTADDRKMAKVATASAVIFAPLIGGGQRRPVVADSFMIPSDGKHGATTRHFADESKTFYGTRTVVICRHGFVTVVAPLSCRNRWASNIASSCVINDNDLNDLLGLRHTRRAATGLNYVRDRTNGDPTWATLIYTCGGRARVRANKRRIYINRRRRSASYCLRRRRVKMFPVHDGTARC